MDSFTRFSVKFKSPSPPALTVGMYTQGDI